MCKILGVMCNDSNLLSCAIHEVNDSLRSQVEQDVAGIGIGYYFGEDPLLKRRPINEPNLIDFGLLFEGIETNAILFCTHLTMARGWKTKNTNPFRFQRWLFAHTGNLPALVAQQKQIVEALAPHIARNIRGETDSELAFCLLLDIMFRAGTLNDVTIDTEVIAQHMREFVKKLNEMHVDCSEDASFAIILTNGQVMASVNRSKSMHYSHREGIHACPKHTGSVHDRQSHARFKGIMLGAQMTNPGHQWREIGDESLLTISKGLELKVSPI